MEHCLGTVESRFADIVWSHEPLPMGELVKLCARELNWKRTTTYTVLKKLGERGFFRLENGTVSSLISREDYYASQSEQFVAESFGGSLPAFIAAFSKRRTLSKKEIAQIRAMIDAWEEE